MARPFTRAQALENTAFIRELRRTGNVRDTCRTIGRHRATFTKRRARDAAFAADWDAALAVAHAAAQRREIKALHNTLTQTDRRSVARDAAAPVAIRTAAGRLQLRRAQPKRLTREAEQAFLAALSSTANVRLSAAAAGFSHSAFYHRRKQSPAFAREMRLALQQGYDTVESALHASFRPDAHADDAWRHNDPPLMPRMTPDQALQLLYLHQKEARLLAEPPHLRRRRGESREAHAYRMAEMYREGQRRSAEAYEIAEAARAERDARCEHELPPPMLPALDQVSGWSKASGKSAHREGVALFGGWRLGEYYEE